MMDCIFFTNICRKTKLEINLFQQRRRNHVSSSTTSSNVQMFHPHASFSVKNFVNANAIAWFWKKEMMIKRNQTENNRLFVCQYPRNRDFKVLLFHSLKFNMNSFWNEKRWLTMQMIMTQNMPSLLVTKQAKQPQECCFVSSLLVSWYPWGWCFSFHVSCCVEHSREKTCGYSSFPGKGIRGYWTLFGWKKAISQTDTKCVAMNPRMTHSEFLSLPHKTCY
jgi:hypothetical protein